MRQLQIPIQQQILSAVKLLRGRHKVSLFLKSNLISPLILYVLTNVSISIILLAPGANSTSNPKTILAMAIFTSSSANLIPARKKLINNFFPEVTYMIESSNYLPTYALPGAITEREVRDFLGAGFHTSEPLR